MTKLKTALKFLPVLLLLCGFSQAKAQFTYAMIGVNGLTCSACTRAVEMSIRKLDFVQDVQMNLEQTEGKVIFKRDQEVDLSAISKAVLSAGFSVRYMSAAYIFNNVNVSDGFCYSAGNIALQFVNTSEKQINGETVLKFLGKDFQTKSDLNKIKSQLIANCSQEDKRQYFVTL